MKKKSIVFKLLFGCIAVFAASCSKELDQINPNSPTLSSTNTEIGIVGFAVGAIYKNGFNQVDVSTLNVLGDSYFGLCYGYHELMADVISAEAANQSINVVNVPDYVIYDNSVKQKNTSSSRDVFKISNSRDNRSNNPTYFEWTYMYSMLNACNLLLERIDVVGDYSGDAATKKNTLKAWAYWWKGYAYSRIGSLYYSGLAVNSSASSENKYKIHDDIIAESNLNLDKATTLLSSISTVADYTSIVGKLIPSFCQSGNGGILTTDMWKRNINTLKARNLIVAKRATALTTADLTAIKTLADAGINSTDFVFTGRTTTANGFFSAGGGSVAIQTTGDPAGSTFKISERFIQEYKTGDMRKSNNFKLLSAPYLNQVGGFSFSNRYELIDGGNSMAGVSTLTNSTPGSYELYIAGSYEENELIKAECNIRSGAANVDMGLTSIDNVRTYQGAGIANVSATGLSQVQALEELRKERRVALIFRGLSFYDARRWGVIDDISKGGGRTGCVVVSSSGVLNTNATINYNFSDFWDVPADEVDLNPPAAGSAATKNPN
jgi:starch-binding outer membrane protein, SusD/RagB family